MRKGICALVVLAFLGVAVVIGNALASIEGKNFFNVFGVAYSPGANEQPQTQFAVLQKLLQSRSQYKESARREIEVVKAIEAVRDSIANGDPDMAEQKQLVEMLKEQASLPEQKKKLFSSYYDACKLARTKNFNESADLAGCDFLSSVDIGELGNQVTALQMK